MADNDGYELTLYFYPSPFGMNWTTPQFLAWSTLLNQFSRAGRSIGHVHVELKRPKNANSKWAEHLITGMTQISHSEERQLLFFKQVGLGIIFHNFHGTLETTEDSIDEINDRFRKGTISFLKFKISEETFDFAHQYLSEYREKECHNHYGLPNRPLHGEGGGCSAFAASFLQATGLMEPEFEKHWSQQRLVPLHLLGGGYSDPEYYGDRAIRTVKKDKRGNRKVPFLKIILGIGSLRWANPDEPNREIFFWDPDLMHDWLLNTYKRESEKNEKKYVIENRHNALGLVYDRTNVKPIGPIWK